MSCPSPAPVLPNTKVNVIYDPSDSSMKACVGSTWITLSGGGGGGGTLNDLTDVVVSSPTANQALVYNGANWTNTNLTVTESDPQVGTMVANKWCAVNAGGTAIDCAQDAPILVESDPTIGTLTNGKWCSTDGTTVNCTQDAPSGATSSGAIGYVQLSDGSGGFTTSGTTAGQQLFWDNTNKRLGIGTTTPGLETFAGRTYLTVKGTTDAGVLEFASGGADADSAQTGLIQFIDVNSTGTSKRVAGISVSLDGSTANNRGGAIRFFTRADSTGANVIERMRVSGIGTVGIGTSAPDASALLDVSSTARGFLPPRMTTTDVGNIATPADGLMVYDTDTDTLKLRANGAWVSLGTGGTSTQWTTTGSDIYYNTGNVGIGTATPARLLHIATGASDTFARMSTDSTHAAQFEFIRGTTGSYIGPAGGSAGFDLWTYEDIPFRLASNNTERMRIDTSGNVGIGTTNPSVTLDVYGDIVSNGSNMWRFHTPDDGRTTLYFGYGANGVVTGWPFSFETNGTLTIAGNAFKPGGGSWAASSDARLKDIDGPYQHGLSSIVRLNTVRFHYKKDNPREEPSDRQFVGLIAQDVQKVFPEAVSERADGYLDLDTTPINFALINAVKELKAANDNLRATVEAQGREIERLKTKP